MATCTSCGHNVSGKKFCPDCGTPVQVEAASATCPRCSGTVKPGAAFCMHCGSALGAQIRVATATPLPATRQCPSCYAEVPTSSAFCTNCGQSMQPQPVTTPAASS